LFISFFVSSAVALVLLKLQKTTNLPGDALLGLLAHSSLAVGLAVISFLSFIRFDIMGLLFGDILAVAPKRYIYYLDWWSINIISFKDYLETTFCFNS